ncbi:MAG TPA: GNAT family N-acetyltransferase [Frankiaceae bacterium]|nr:GNAT family N-acetyltransferase [Frankiaceae bacterium]
MPFAEAAELVAELDADLTVRYGGDGDPVHAPAQEFDGPGGQMLLASLAGEAVGCAGVRRIDDATAELKRMYVRPQARGRGIAKQLLAACEREARALGYGQLWLETGTMQPEAVTLYLTSGYEPIPAFGQYAGQSLSIHLGRAL